MAFRLFVGTLRLENNGLLIGKQFWFENCQRKNCSRTDHSGRRPNVNRWHCCVAVRFIAAALNTSTFTCIIYLCCKNLRKLVPRWLRCISHCPDIMRKMNADPEYEFCLISYISQSLNHITECHHITKFLIFGSRQFLQTWSSFDIWL